jgi:hypothetical protein
LLAGNVYGSQLASQKWQIHLWRALVEILSTDQRLEHLERRLRSLMCLCGLLTLALGVLSWRSSSHSVKAAESPSVLHVRGLVVEDERGRARILLGAPFSAVHDRLRQDTTATSLLFLDEQGHDRISMGEVMPAQIDGKVPANFHRIGSSYALNIYDPVGNERGGMGFLTNDKGLNRAVVALDRSGHDAVGMMVDDRTDYAGLGVDYSPKVGEWATGAQLATMGPKAFLMLKDVRDMPRATLSIEADRPPSFQTFDKDGKPVDELIKAFNP